MNHGRDRLIADLARRQHGVVTTPQLGALGMGRGCVSKRAQRGLLHRAHQGVYFVGHDAPSFHGIVMAAVLAAGPDACATGLSAAELYRVSRFPRSNVDLVSPCQHVVPGVRCRHSRLLGPADIWTRMGIPTAIPARVLVDLAADLTAYQLANVMHQLAYRRLLNRRRVAQLARRCSRFHGHDVLAEAIRLHGEGSAGTRSMLEDRTVQRFGELGAPAPQVNTIVHIRGEPHELDLHWPQHRLAVEIDGPGHERPACRVGDTALDELAAADGIRLVRIREATLDRDVRSVAAMFV